MTLMSSDVSILVLVDLAREYLNTAISVQISIFVSILVLVDLARELRVYTILRCRSEVSILVLVDLARESITTAEELATMFQSLF